MNEVEDKVAAHQDKIGQSGNGGRVFAHSDSYNDAVTIEIITTELLRNIILAIVCIFIITLLLLTDILGSLMVLFCVIFTIVDVAGFMHFWGLTIDTVSALLLTVIVYYTLVENLKMCLQKLTFRKIHSCEFEFFERKINDF